jgi:hypothetical protein
MTCRLIVLIASIAISGARAEDFVLTAGGIGPIALHTELTWEGKGDRLIASATNKSSSTIPYVKLCVRPDPKGCLFSLWNTKPWQPGESLSWDLAGTRRTPNLFHQVAIIDTSAGKSPAITTEFDPGKSAKGQIPVRNQFRSKAHLYNVETGQVLQASYTRGAFRGGKGQIDIVISPTERAAGEYAGVTDGAISWGSIYGSVYSGAASASANASGMGISTSTMGHGSAIAVSEQGTVIQCEFVSSGLTGHGMGGCTDNKGSRFRLIF